MRFQTRYVPLRKESSPVDSISAQDKHAIRDDSNPTDNYTVPDIDTTPDDDTISDNDTSPLKLNASVVSEDMLAVPSMKPIAEDVFDDVHSQVFPYKMDTSNYLYFVYVCTPCPF